MTTPNDRTALPQWFHSINPRSGVLSVSTQGLSPSLARSLACTYNNTEEINICAKVFLFAISYGGSTLCPQTHLVVLFLFCFYIFVVFIAVLRFSPPLAPHSPLIDPRLLRLHSTMAGRPQRPHHPLVPGPPRVSGHGCFRLRNLPLVSLRGLWLRGSSGSEPLAGLPLFQGLEVRVRDGSES